MISLIKTFLKYEIIWYWFDEYVFFGFINLIAINYVWLRNFLYYFSDLETIV